MTRFLVYGLLGIGFLALAGGWALTDFWPVSLLLLVLTPLFLYLVKRKIIPTLSIALVLGAMAAAFGISFGMRLPYALGGVVLLLAAWDLDGFSRRLALAAPQDEPDFIQRQQLLRLGLVILFGLGTSLFVLNVRLQFNFELAIGLVVLVFASLAALLAWLKKIER